MASEQCCQHCKGPVSECEGKSFKKYYLCSECSFFWIDVWWCGASNYLCLSCGTETEPYKVMEL